LHELHQRYGTAVRIAPNEISFSDRGSIKEIYGQQTTFMKAPIYHTMSLPPFGIFSMRNRADHSQRRRLLSHAFAQSSLYESEPLIKDNVKALLSRLENGLEMAVDVMSLFRLLAFDIVGKTWCHWPYDLVGCILRFV
jgi:cytochrome P450